MKKFLRKHQFFDFWGEKKQGKKRQDSTSDHVKINGNEFLRGFCIRSK